MSFSQARSSLLHVQWTRNGLEGTVSQVWHCPREDNSGKLAHFPDPANEVRGLCLVKGLVSQPCAWGSLTIIRYFYFFYYLSQPIRPLPLPFVNPPFPSVVVICPPVGKLDLVYVIVLMKGMQRCRWICIYPRSIAPREVLRSLVAVRDL